MKMPVLSFAACASILFSSLTGYAEDMNNTPPAGRVERYEYEAFRAGRRQPGEKETIVMELTHSDEGISHTSVIEHNDRREIINIFAGADGRFFSGERKLLDDAGRLERKDSISRDNDRVYIQHHSDSAGRVRERTLRGDRPLAVDASLLILLRSFPFDNPGKQEVFMVDFFGRSVFASVSLGGTEHIEVPAGEFKCYRMDVTVNLLIARPRVTFWISEEKPHFMVKHSGRRGPFTPVYETFLVSKELPDENAGK